MPAHGLWLRCAAVLQGGLGRAHRDGHGSPAESISDLSKHGWGPNFRVGAKGCHGLARGLGSPTPGPSSGGRISSWTTRTPRDAQNPAKMALAPLRLWAGELGPSPEPQTSQTWLALRVNPAARAATMQCSVTTVAPQKAPGEIWHHSRRRARGRVGPNPARSIVRRSRPPASRRRAIATQEPFGASRFPASLAPDLGIPFR